MTHSTCQLSVILPCFNVIGHLESSLRALVPVLNSQQITWEIIIVDDGSNDNTSGVLNSFSDIRIKLIKLEENRGKYAAIKLGVLKSLGEVIIFTDSDLPYGSDSIFDIYRLIHDQSFEIVVGDRTHLKSTSLQQTPIIRKIASKCFCWISSLIFVSAVKDTQCGLKGFNREIAKKLFPIIRDTRFGGDFEILFLASKYKIKLATIPVTLTSVGVSSVHVLVDGLKILFRSLTTVLLWSFGGYPKSLNK